MGRAPPPELARFRVEAEAVTRLRHPNIVSIHEVGQTAGRPHFALEYLPGGSLESKLAGQPQPSRHAAALIRTLAQAVHHAHAPELERYRTLISIRSRSDFQHLLRDMKRNKQ